MNRELGNRVDTRQGSYKMQKNIVIRPVHVKMDFLNLGKELGYSLDPINRQHGSKIIANTIIRVTNHEFC